MEGPRELALRSTSHMPSSGGERPHISATHNPISGPGSGCSSDLAVQAPCTLSTLDSAPQDGYLVKAGTRNDLPRVGDTKFIKMRQGFSDVGYP